MDSCRQQRKAQEFILYNARLQNFPVEITEGNSRTHEHSVADCFSLQVAEYSFQYPHLFICDQFLRKLMAIFCILMLIICNLKSYTDSPASQQQLLQVTAYELLPALPQPVP